MHINTGEAGIKSTQCPKQQICCERQDSSLTNFLVYHAWANISVQLVCVRHRLHLEDVVFAHFHRRVFHSHQQKQKCSISGLWLQWIQSAAPSSAQSLFISQHHQVLLKLWLERTERVESEAEDEEGPQQMTYYVTPIFKQNLCGNKIMYY